MKGIKEREWNWRRYLKNVEERGWKKGRKKIYIR